MKLIPGFLRRRPWRWSAVALLAVLLGGWWSIGAVTGEPTSWETVKRDDLVLGVEVTGTLKATETSSIGPPQLRIVWQFKIAHMAPEGEEVKEGGPVLVFDTSELQQRLQRQMAESQSAQKQIEKAEKELAMRRQGDEFGLAEAESRRNKAKLKVDVPGELSKAMELAQARLDLELAEREIRYREERLDSSRRSAEAYLGALRNQRDRAEQEVREIGHAIEEMTRKAPRDGTVVYVADWQGEKKKVGDSLWRGQPVIEVPDLDEMQGLGQVHEADAGKVREGQRVTLKLDAHPDDEFTGQVTSIWRTVQRGSWRTPLKVVRLEIRLDRTDVRKMRPGMRFRGEIETERVDDALLVPTEAVFRTPTGPVVFRRTWLGHEPVEVELGRRTDARIEVLGGLREGDSVSLTDLGRRRPA